MRKVAVIGAGKIGSTVVDLLVGSGSYEAVLIDQAAEALGEFAGRAHVTTAAIRVFTGPAGSRVTPSGSPGR